MKGCGSKVNGKVGHEGAVIGNILPVFDIEKPFVSDLVIGQRIEFENETLWK